jgi:hypothetical protein
MKLQIQKSQKFAESEVGAALILTPPEGGILMLQPVDTGFGKK